MTLLTGGVIWIVLYTNIVAISRIVRNKDYTKSARVELVIIFAGLISFLGMNVLIAINGVTNIGELKWLTFYRYGKPFVGILLITALYELYLTKNKSISMNIAIVSVLGTLLSVMVILFYTVPRLQGSDYIDVSKVGWFKYYFYAEQEAEIYFSVFGHVAIWGAVLFAYLLYKRKNYLLIIVFTYYSLVLTYSENKYNMKISDYNYEMVDETEKCLRQYIKNGSMQIYYLQGVYSGKLRYVLYDYDMEYLLDVDEIKQIDCETSILLTDSKEFLQKSNNQFKYFIVLDEYEYICTSNDEVYSLLSTHYRGVRKNSNE